MRVERCASCGAPYNVSTLEPGRAFACRRCGAQVTVSDGEPAAAPSGRSAGLVAVGVSMLLSLLLYAHPTIGYRQAQWPWQYWLETQSILHRADLVVWVVVALLAIAVGAGALRRSGPGLLLAGVLVLALRGYSEPAAFHVSRMSLVWMAATVALGAGFLRRASLRPVGSAFRVLLAAGAAVTFFVFAVFFPAEGGGRVFFELKLLEIEAVWKGRLPPEQIWALHVPFLLQWAAVLLGGFLALAPRTMPGGRALAAAGFASLLLTWLLPAASLAARTWDEMSRSARQAANVVATEWFGEGLALFLVASLAIATLAARARVEAPAPPPVGTP